MVYQLLTQRPEPLLWKHGNCFIVGFSATHNFRGRKAGLGYKTLQGMDSSQ